MKSQMKFQKILTLVTLIIAALSFVFALIFFSGNLSKLMFYIGKNWAMGRYKYSGADDFLLPAQTFVSLMVVLSIVLIVLVAVLYITSTNSRRNYYVTNYVAIGLVAGFGLVVSLVGIIYLTVLVSEFYAINWEELQEFIERLKNANNKYQDVNDAPYMFIIGYVVFMLVLSSAVAWILNLVWKIKLMRGEKALLENGLSKEVA